MASLEPMAKSLVDWNQTAYMPTGRVKAKTWVADGAVLIGDAAYTSVQYTGPADAALPPGQASDRVAWTGSLAKIRSAGPARVHFCHDTAVLHG